MHNLRTYPKTFVYVCYFCIVVYIVLYSTLKPKIFLESVFAADKKKKKKLSVPKIYIMFNAKLELQLRAYIYQGRDLLPMDEDNFSGR